MANRHYPDKEARLEKEVPEQGSHLLNRTAQRMRQLSLGNGSAAAGSSPMNPVRAAPPPQGVPHPPAADSEAAPRRLPHQAAVGEEHPR